MITLCLSLPLVLLIQGKLKTDFGWSGGPSLAWSCWEKNPEGRHQTPQKLSKRNQKIFFFVDFCFMFIWYFVYDFFCLLFFVCFLRFVLITLRKTTNTVHTVFLRFLFFCNILCCISIYIYFRDPRSIHEGNRATNSGIWILLPLSLKFIRLVLFIGSTKIVSHFLRNFVERDVFVCTLQRPLRDVCLDCQLSRCVRDRAHAHKRRHSAVAWSQKLANRQSKRRMAVWRSVKRKPSSKSTRTNCYRYIFFFPLFYIFII